MQRRPRRRITGPVIRSAARAAGLNDRHLRQAGVLRLSRDTYLPASMGDDACARLAAVLLTAPPGAVASHRTAAVLWGVEIPLQDHHDRRVDLTVPTAGRAESRRDRRIHRIALEDEEVVRRGAVPITTPERTWRDLAGVLPAPALLAVTDQLLRRSIPRADLERQLARRPTGRGCARARDVLPIADPRAESPMESVLRWLLHGAGLPVPDLQYVVRDGAGTFLARVDLAWPEQRVLVEFDGDLHRGRDVFVNDLRRQNRLVAAGWTVLRFTSADVLGRPDDVIAEIRRALQ